MNWKPVLQAKITISYFLLFPGLGMKSPAWPIPPLMIVTICNIYPFVYALFMGKDGGLHMVLFPLSDTGERDRGCPFPGKSRILSGMLACRGIFPENAGDGEKAMRACARQGYDLALMDCPNSKARRKS